MNAVGILQLLEVIAGIGSQIYLTFASKSKEAPIVETLTPVALKVMHEAESIFGPSTGAVKLQHVQNTLTEVVNAGLAVSKGGQLHTVQELQAAMPAITAAINESINLLNNWGGNIVTLQPSEG